jgi:hypothetical protein
MTRTTFDYIVYFWIIFAIILFPLLLKVTVPYGRYTTRKWGSTIDNRAGWIIMEFPALATFSYLVISSGAQANTVIWIFWSFWFLHYFHRVCIYPFRTKTKGKRMPLAIMFFAIFFNLMNGFINGYWFGYLAKSYVINWLYDPRFIIGVLLFLIGVAINQDSDQRLLSLRTKGSTDYYIPYGGLFKYISCPNFFGEITEWLGFAVMTWCMPTLSFFLWTCVNLIPRALDHHQWYKEQFANYPSERKAIIPFIL